MILRSFIVAIASFITVSVHATELKMPYDLLFREGTLGSITAQERVVYQRKVQNRLKPENAERDTGKIILSFRDDAKRQAQITFVQDDKSRPLGVFPAQVGNPMIMYFYESVLRDMAETVGGSPFYIRDRIKEALITPAEQFDDVIKGQSGDLPAISVVLRPFANDPNKDRMGGFGELMMYVTMSQDVPGWYYTLIAEVPNGDKEFLYRSEITFENLETEQ